MGKYSKNLVKRVNIKGPKEGFCAICRNHAKLTRDHVPPQGCDNAHDVIMSTYPQFNNNPVKPRGTTGQSGTKFKTICSKCNNVLLGTLYDPSLIHMAQQIVVKAPNSKADWESGPASFEIQIQRQKIARAVIGHLIAANAFHELSSQEEDPPFLKSLRGYLLTPSAPLPDKVDVFFWIHPHRKQEIFKHVGKSELGRGMLWIGHILKFNPLGFLVTWQAESMDSPYVYPLFDDKHEGPKHTTSLLVDRKFCPPINFPIAVSDDSMEFILFNDEQCIYSTPKKNSEG